MARFLHAGLIILANFLIPLAIFTFATGFFPYKPFLSGLAQYETLEYGPPPTAPFDRVIFMVVDALRSDFVYSEGSGFQFTQELIRDGAAWPFTANARSPTITMPRIKAITTGSIPSFLDVILNFDEGDKTSSLAVQDTWLAQIKAKATGKLIMFGDDTWLKLFPDTFDRADGTSSFFVSDFTEVDNNVTRHVARELQRDDWSAMILHYLGLDHIGHKTGPRSPNMLPKQLEMDGIVRQLYDAMKQNEHLSSTILVLCGDHGMNDAGNHGASSPGETSAALVFVSPKLMKISAGTASPVVSRPDFQYYSTVEQSDIAPTLAGFLGFPVPKNNLGVFIPSFLPLWPQKSGQMQILLRNARQILNVVTAALGDQLFDQPPPEDLCLGMATGVQRLACDWHVINRDIPRDADDEVLNEEWQSRIVKWIRNAQDLMSSRASNFDMSRLLLGQLAALAACMSAICAVAMSSYFPLRDLMPFGMVTLLYGSMMFASSYIEEEHHYWYWSSSIWLGFLARRHLSKNWSLEPYSYLAGSLLSTRLIRGWNQTGQKFAGEPDIVKSFISTNPWILWTVVGVTYTTIQIRMAHRLGPVPAWITFALAGCLVSAAFTFKLAFANEDAPELVVGLARKLNEAARGPSLVARARQVFLGISALASLAVYAAVRRRQTTDGPSKILHHLSSLVVITQSRLTNIPLLTLMSLQFQFLKSTDLSLLEITLSSILLQHMSFFAFGGTNAISSVDLSSAYNGVSGFSVVSVGILTFVSNWAAPIYWTSATNLLLLLRHREGQKDVFRRHVYLLTVFVTCSVAFVMAACTLLRTHLFIWTVFSPKYLYCMAWSIGQHLLVNIGLGGALFWIGTR